MNNIFPNKPYAVPPITYEQLKQAEEFSKEELLRAHVAIAKINGFISGAPSAKHALTNPIYLKEALESSEIENINTTLLDVLQQQILPTSDKKSKEGSQLVVNYYIALLWGINNLNKLGLSSRLICGLHKTLIPEDSDGFRRNQVNISDGRGTVRYTPPEAQHIPDLISDWQKLVNNTKGIDPLVVAAAAHYQFEAIHPFTDGNGRTGRMLLTLHLVDKRLLQMPAVHISQYINSNRNQYYQLLRGVSGPGGLDEFVRYIVRGFAIQAELSFRLLKKLQVLQSKTKANIKQQLPGVYRTELVDAIFYNIVQSPVTLSKDMGIHYVTASKYLKRLAQAGFLVNKKSGRNMYYINTKMLDLLQEKGRVRFSEVGNE